MKETQKAKIERLEQEIIKLNKENEDLSKENREQFRKLGEGASYRVTLYDENIKLKEEVKELHKKMEIKEEFYRDTNTSMKKLEETLILSAKKNIVIMNLEKEIEGLKEALSKSENYSEVKKIKNERGAGRKERFTDYEKETMKMYRIQGKSYLYIAKMFNCSVGLVHKIINKRNNS